MRFETRVFPNLKASNVFIGYWLLVIGNWLLVTGYWLLVTLNIDQ